MIVAFYANDKLARKMGALQIWKRFQATAQAFEVVDWKLSQQLAETFRCRIKECYSNCLSIAALLPELAYHEGIATKIVPTDHAWLVTKDGTVVDPTYVLMDVERVDYFGIPLSIKEVMTRGEAYLPGWVNHIERQLKEEKHDALVSTKKEKKNGRRN